MTTDVIARLDRCSKAYRRGVETVHALRGVSLTLLPGELVAVAGPSGSGKTTLLNLLVGWERPDSGSVDWIGAVVPPPWRTLGVVPQRLGLVEELTVAENVWLPMSLDPSRALPDGYVDGLLDALRIAHLGDRLPHQVSLGEQQRTAIARALVLRPAVVVLDEPTAHQDEDSATAVMVTLRHATLDGTCCVVASHAPDLLETVDRIVRLADGRVAARA